MNCIKSSLSLGSIKQLLMIVLTTTLFSNGINAQSENDFVITIQTDESGDSDERSFSIPTSGSGYNYKVDWNNDGVWDETGLTGGITHNFGTKGTYTIRISGDFPRIFFNSSGDNGKLIRIDQWGNNPWQTMENAFSGCSNLQLTATDSPNLSQVTNLSYMFSSASSLNADLSSWDVSNITSMKGMFLKATSFNGNISSWDIGKVTDLSFMFSEAAAFNGAIGSWNTFSVGSMKSMFEFASSFNQSINNWDVSGVSDMSRMFAQATSFNQSLNNWDVSRVRFMPYMFFSALAFNGNIKNWDTRNVQTMIYMFSSTLVFNQPIGIWDVRNVTDMEGMFHNTIAFNQPIGDWNTSNVTDMSRMFEDSKAFDQFIGAWDISKTTDFNSFLLGSQISVKAYDNLLTGWASQTPKSSVSFNAGASEYCQGEAARNTLINSFNWSFSDSGKNCNVTNSAPDNINITIDQVKENIPSGTVVGELAASDPDPIDKHTYSLVAGNGDEDNSKFAIEGSKLKIQFIPDYENPVDLGDTPANNTYSIRVKTDDGYGGTFTKSIIINVTNINEDTTPPDKPTIESISEDSGLSSEDGITNDQQISIIGKAEALSTVEVFFDQVSVGTTNVDASGEWTFDYSNTTLSDGTYSLTATATDSENNTSQKSDPFDLTIDTSNNKPSISAISEDTGTSSADGITNDNRLVFKGSAKPNSQVDVFVNNVKVGFSTASSDGSWSYDFTREEFLDGDHFATCKSMDIAGNVSEVSSTFNFQVKTSASAPSITSIDEDTGNMGASDGITSDTRLVFIGTASPGDEVTLFRDGIKMGFTTANSGGIWDYDYTTESFNDGTYAITAQALDKAGNQSPLSTVFTLIVDTQVPAAPEILAISSDSGLNQSDGITNDNSLVFSGTSEAKGETEIFLNGNSLGLTFPDAQGTWSFDNTHQMLADGNYELSAKHTDLAGNTGTASTVFKFIVDTSAPSAPTITSPSNNAILNTVIPTITGRAEPGTQVTVTSRAITCTSISDVNGIWRCTISTALTSNTDHTFSAIQTDKAGNSSLTSSSITFRVNNTPSDILLSNASIDENNDPTDEIGSLSVTDPDNSDTHTYSLVTGNGDSDNSSFSITGNKLLARHVFDFETQNSFSVRVKVEDNHGASFEKALTVTVNNVSEPSISIPGTVDFDPTGLGLSTEKTITIENTGDIDLSIDLNLPEGFNTIQNSVNVGTGSSLELTITFEPTEAKDYSGELKLTFEGLEEQIQLSGSGEIITSIDEEQKAASLFTTYPNPVSNHKLTIDLSGLSKSSLLTIRPVADTKVVWQHEVAPKLITINTHGFSSGIYLVEIKGQGFTYTKKVIIK